MNEYSSILKNIAEDVINAGQQQIRDNDSVASGKLVDSFQYKLTGNMIIISFLAYGGYLDVKTGPSKSTEGDGFYDKIKEWVKFKGIPKGAAWPIYKSILKKGTKAHPWIFKMEEVVLNLDDKILSYLSTIVDDKVTAHFNKMWLKK